MTVRLTEEEKQKLEYCSNLCGIIAVRVHKAALQRQSAQTTTQKRVLGSA